MWPGPLGAIINTSTSAGGLDLAVVDVEAVGEGQSLASGEVGGDVLLIHIGLTLVVDEDHDDIGNLGGLGGLHNGEAVLLCHGPALAALVQADDHVTAGITQIHGVGVALGAVTHDGNLLASEVVEVAILFVVHLSHDKTLL